MSTIGTVLSTRIYAALRDAAVAAQAGVAAGTWASTTVSHVFRDFTGYMLGRNRGRLPFIEFEISSEAFHQDTVEGGTVKTTVTLRAHVGGRDPEAASNMLEGILAAGMAKIRSEAVDNYTALGDDAMQPTVPGPWGLMREVAMEFEHTYDRGTYDSA